MENKRVVVETEGSVAILTVNRPEALNALDSATLIELESAIAEIGADRSVRALVVTGAGKAFVAGADIKAMSAMTSAEALAFARRGQSILGGLSRMGKPSVAAVNGYALGGGLELAMACDFIYASNTAKLGLPETTLGLIPGFGGTRRLARLVGPNRARELVLSGKPIDAATALAWGLVNALFAPEELLAKAKERAIAMASVGPHAVRSAREAIDFGLDSSLSQSLDHEAALFGLLFADSDAREGMTAFVEKRKPDFKGE